MLRLAVLILSVGAAQAQEAPLPQAALIQCVTASQSTNAAHVDAVCSDLAMDVCGVGRSAAQVAACRAEMACRFVTEATLLAENVVAPVPSWAAQSEGCAATGAAGAACRQDAAALWWQAVRAAARAESVPTPVLTEGVALCYLD